MDESAVRAVVKEHAQEIRDSLRLWEWHIDLEYAPASPQDGLVSSGSVRVEAPYRHATIRLDPNLLDDEAEVLKVLRHELIHVFLWPAHSFADWASKGLEGFDDAEHHVWTFHIERLVGDVERLLDTREEDDDGE